jgi:hypothetical protein
MEGTVLVVAKAPGPRSKTRLVPPLSPAQAAALHGALLQDTVEACRRDVADVRVLYADASDRAGLADVLPGVRLERQEGRGLADALRLAVAARAARGPVAIVSSDIPGLPDGALRRCFAALADGADVVLGPALDGGYWLVALREPRPEPFREIPWSTPAVLAVTRQRCRDAGLRLVELAPWRDVDTLADLAFLARDTEGLVAPRTVALVRGLGALLHAPPPVELHSSELLAASPWRAVIRDRLVRDGDETSYSYVAAPRAVFVAAVTEGDELLLVRQYRHPVRDWTLEVPAGSARDGETALDAARRELREETGGRAGDWRHLTTFYSSSAHLSLRSDAFLATGVVVGQAAPEAGEDVALVRMPVGEAVALARSGGFAEGQTALTILLAGEELEARPGD